MTTIELSHRGHKIRFLEDSEEWLCDDFNIREAKLATVKRRIDNASKSERTANVKALRIETGSYWHKETTGYTEVTVTTLCEAPKQRFNNKKPEIEECWIKETDGSRSKMYIKSLAPLSAIPAIKDWIRLAAVAQTAEKARDETFEAIPKHTADTLMPQAKEEKSK